MLTFRFYILFVIFQGTLCSILHGQEQTWKLTKKKDGISVYSKDIKGSAIRSFKATGLISAELNEILDVLSTPDNFPLWLERCRQVNVLQDSSSSMLIYMEVSTPFPFSNRDMVQELQFNTQMNQVEIELTSRPEVIPEKGNLVRLETANGYWHLQEMDKGVMVTFEFTLDPGGLIPGWIANIFLVNGPYKNLKSLSEYVQSFKS
jgi:hypothetical protein